MSYSEIMIYAVQLDTWKQRFGAIIEYNKLDNPDGYKFLVKNNACYLDPPTLWQHISRWYYGYSNEQFLRFLEDHKPRFFKYLYQISDDAQNTQIFQGKTQPAREFVSNLVFFTTELARACSVARRAYPEFDQLNTMLLAYYHGIQEWITKIGY